MTPEEIERHHVEREVRLADAAKRLDDAGWVRVANVIVRDVTEEFGDDHNAMKIALLELMALGAEMASTRYQGQVPMPVQRFVTGLAGDPERAREMLAAPGNMDHVAEIPERGRRALECLLRVLVEQAVIEQFEN